MESRLSEKIDTFCHLNFSNQIAKNSNSIFYSKNVHPNPMNPRKKIEKISLKNLKQELASAQVKNSQPKIVQVQKQSPQIKNYSQSAKSDFRTVKSSARLISPYSAAKQFHSNSLSNTKLHKSFQEVSQRVQMHQRSSIYDSRRSDFQRISISQKSRKINDFLPTNVVTLKDSGSLINENKINSQKRRIKIQKQEESLVSQVLLQKNSEPYFTLIPQLNQSIQRLKLDQVFLNKERTENQSLSSVKVSQIFQQAQVSLKRQEKKSKTQSTADIQKFRHFHDQIQLERQIQCGLIAQKQPFNDQKSKQRTYFDICQSEKEYFAYKSRVNSEQSAKSFQGVTQIKDKFLIEQIQKQHIFYQPRNKKEKLQTSDFFQKIDNTLQSSNCNLGSYRFNKQQNLVNSSFLSQSQTLNEGKDINNLQFSQKWQGANKFKSVISIRSESETSELEESFIIYNYLKEKISSKPIQPFF